MKGEAGETGENRRHLPTFNTLVYVENLERSLETVKTLLAAYDRCSAGLLNSFGTDFGFPVRILIDANGTGGRLHLRSDCTGM